MGTGQQMTGIIISYLYLTFLANENNSGKYLASYVPLCMGSSTSISVYIHSPCSSNSIVSSTNSQKKAFAMD